MDKNFIGVTFNNYKVVVNNAKKVSGHDDTLPFNADFEVYKDGNLFFDGKAWNDGWGGPSCLNYDKKNHKQKDERFADTNAVNLIRNLIDKPCICTGNEIKYHR